MSKIMSIEENIQTINDFLDKLKSGNLSVAEVQKLTSVARELYEKCIILQFKAFEQKVNGNVDHIEEFHIPSATEALMEENDIVDDEVEVIVDEKPAFEFNLFDEVAPQQETQDLFVQEHLSEPEIVEEVPAPAIFNEEKEEKLADFQEEVQQIEVVQEQIQVTPSNSNQAELLALIDKSESSFAIPSLLGAFGLNERLQCVKELFDGSSEAFAMALKELDNQENFEDAIEVALRWKDKFQWNLQHESCKDLINKIKRRYA